MNQDFLGSMTNGEKLIAGGSLVLLVGLFLPWYGVDAGLYSASVNGFHSWGLLTFLALLVVVALWVIRSFLNDSVKLPEMSVSDALIYMIAGGVEVLGCIIFWLSYSTDVSIPGFSAGVRFGLFVSLIGAIATVVGGYLKQSEPATAAPAPPMGGPPSYSPPPPPPAAPPAAPPPPSAPPAAGPPPSGPPPAPPAP
jgi:hypothetical protein